MHVEGEGDHGTLIRRLESSGKLSRCWGGKGDCWKSIRRVRTSEMPCNRASTPVECEGGFRASICGV